jgi:hypothetical protein
MYARVDPARSHRSISGAVPTPRTRRQAHIGEPADRDRRAQPIDQIKQRVRPSGKAVVQLAPEPAKFTLVNTAGLDDTTNNGHLVLPEKIRLSSE